MHAYLIVGSDNEKIAEKADEIIKEGKMQAIEFPLEKIADVRELSKYTKLSRNEPTAIFIKDLEKASIEALNAFLKNLEEPQKSIAYILTAGSQHKIPETIVSRCRVIRVIGDSGKATDGKIEKFLENTLSDKFRFIDSIKKREDAVFFIENLISVLHRSLVDGNESKIETACKLREAQRTLDALNANGNIRLQLSRFAIVINKLG